MKLISLEFCQDNIKQAIRVRSKIAPERINMGVEVIGPAVVSVAPAVGRVASSVGGALTEAPSIGALSGIGEISAPIMEVGYSIVNEGPVAPTFLEFNPIEEIIFNQPELNVGDAVAEAEAIIAQTRINPLTEEGAVEEAIHWLGPEKSQGIQWIPDPAESEARLSQQVPYKQEVSLKVLKEAEAVAHKAWENHPITQAENIVRRAEASFLKSTPGPLEQIVEKEVVEVEDRVEDKKNTLEEEETQGWKLRYVEDKKVTEQRIYEFGEAINKAADETGEVEGKKVISFLPAEGPENQSQIVRGKGPDGSRVETIEEFADRKFASKEEAKRQVKMLVHSKLPVKIEKEGRQVDNETVTRVFKYHHIVKPAAYQVMEQRIFKKRVQISSLQSPVPILVSEEVEIKAEHTLEDLDLAELFQKAA